MEGQKVLTHNVDPTLMTQTFWPKILASKFGQEWVDNWAQIIEKEVTGAKSLALVSTPLSHSLIIS